MSHMECKIIKDLDADMKRYILQKLEKAFDENIICSVEIAHETEDCINPASGWNTINKNGFFDIKIRGYKEK